MSFHCSIDTYEPLCEGEVLPHACLTTDGLMHADTTCTLSCPTGTSGGSITCSASGSLHSYISCSRTFANASGLSVVEFGTGTYSGQYKIGDDCLKGGTPASGTLSVSNMCISNSEFPLGGWDDCVQITELDLSNNLISSTTSTLIPSLIWSMNGLTTLNLRNSQFSGNFPGSVSAHNLKEIDLGNNHLSGELTTVFHPLSLEILNLENNSFSGPIISFTSETIATGGTDNSALKESLKILDLSDNDLTGAIPNTFFDFNVIHYIDLSNNLLSDTFNEDRMNQMYTSTTGSIASFQYLNLGGRPDAHTSKLNGSIQVIVNEFNHLKEFIAYNQEFSGTIPSNWSINLNVLDVSGNQLTGTIPAELASMRELNVVYLDHNNLSGAMPSAWCDGTLNSYQRLTNQLAAANNCRIQGLASEGERNVLSCTNCESPNYFAGCSSETVVCPMSAEDQRKSLFISVYDENGENDNLAIYNPFNATIPLSDNVFMAWTENGANVAGQYDNAWIFPDSALIEPLGSAVLCSRQSSWNSCSFPTNSSMFDGNDALCLMSYVDSGSTAVDCLGDFDATGPDPEFDACGVSDILENNKIVRKCGAVSGNGGDWSASGGTDANDCAYNILPSGTPGINYVDICGEAPTTEAPSDSCEPDCVQDFVMPLKLSSNGKRPDEILAFGTTKDALNMTIARHAGVSTQNVIYIGLTYSTASRDRPETRRLQTSEDPAEDYTADTTTVWYDLNFIVTFDTQKAVDSGVQGISDSAEADPGSGNVSPKFVTDMLDEMTSQLDASDSTATTDWDMISLYAGRTSFLPTIEQWVIGVEKNALYLDVAMDASHTTYIATYAPHVGEPTRLYLVRSFGVWGVTIYGLNETLAYSNVSNAQQISDQNVQYLKDWDIGNNTDSNASMYEHLFSVRLESTSFVNEVAAVQNSAISTDGGNEEAYQVSTVVMAAILCSVLSVVVILAFFVVRKMASMRKSQEILTQKMRSKNNLIRVQRNELKTMKGAWLLDASEVETLGPPLAEGAQGQVFRGSLHGKYEVAVKIFVTEKDESLSSLSSSSKTSSSGLSSLEGGASTSESNNGSGDITPKSSASRGLFEDTFESSEVQFMVSIRHPRLVMFLGVGRFNDGRKFMVSEFMGGGSLDRSIWKSHARDDWKPATWGRRLRYLRDIALGIKFIHGADRVHRDLKSPNVLLDNSKRRCKIADFGLSAIVPRGKHRIRFEKTREAQRPRNNDYTWVKKMKSYVGTTNWMAPEVMTMNAKYGPMADVYSFGCLMYEHIAFEKPWLNTSARTIMDSVKRGERPSVRKELVDDAPLGFCSLMRQCWNMKITRRPTIQNIDDALQKMLVNYDDDLGDTAGLSRKPGVVLTKPRTLNELRARLKSELDAAEAWSDRSDLTRREIERWEEKENDEKRASLSLRYREPSHTLEAFDSISLGSGE